MDEKRVVMEYTPPVTTGPGAPKHPGGGHVAYAPGESDAPPWAQSDERHPERADEWRSLRSEMDARRHGERLAMEQLAAERAAHAETRRELAAVGATTAPLYTSQEREQLLARAEQAKRERDEARAQVADLRWQIECIEREVAAIGLTVQWTDGGGSEAPSGWARRPFINAEPIAEHDARVREKITDAWRAKLAEVDRDYAAERAAHAETLVSFAALRASVEALLARLVGGAPWDVTQAADRVKKVLGDISNGEKYTEEEP